MERPLSEALTQGNIEEAERLLKKWNVNKELSTGETPLLCAIRGKNPRKSDMIRFLIEKCKADVNYEGGFKWTPLHRALNCDAGKDVVEMLVTAKAEISPLGATWQKFVHLEQWLTRYLVCTTDVERAMISKSFVVFSASTNPSHNTPSETLSDKKSVSGSTNPTSSTPSESETLISSLDKKSSSIEVNHVLGVLMTFEGKWQTWRLTAVHREGSMGKAGLLKDDRIKSINEQLVTKANLQAVLERAASDDRGIYTVNICVLRGKNLMAFKVRVVLELLRVTSMAGASAILGPSDVKTEKKLFSSSPSHTSSLPPSAVPSLSLVLPFGRQPTESLIEIEIKNEMPLCEQGCGNERDVLFASCGHFLLCAECANDLLRDTQRCPACATEFDDDDIIRVLTE